MRRTYLVRQLCETAAPLQHVAVPIAFNNGLRPFRDPLLDRRTILRRTFEIIIAFFGNQGHYCRALSVARPNPVSSLGPTIQVHNLPSSVMIAHRIFHILSHLTAPNLPAVTQEIGKVDMSTRMKSREISGEVFQVLLFFREDWPGRVVTCAAGICGTLLEGKCCIDRGIYFHGCCGKFTNDVSIAFFP